MKNQKAKHEKNILKLKNQEDKYFILKSICQNFDFFTLLRWKAFSFFIFLMETKSKVSISFRCVYTINRKRFSTLAPFSRHILLKLIRTGNISGFKKASW